MLWEANGWKRVDPPVRAVCGQNKYLIRAVMECCGLKVRVVPEDAAEGASERVWLVGQEVEVPGRQALDNLRALVGRARAIRHQPPPVPTCREPHHLILHS